MSEQLIRPSDRASLISKLFEVNGKRIVKAVPRSIGADPNRLLTIAFNAIIYDPKLAECTHASLLGGVMEALKLGVTLGGPMQEAWLIPFKNGKTSKLEATFIVGYQGYQNIIARGRNVLDMHPRCVHHDDEFEYWFGLRPNIVHRPAKAAKPVILKKDLRAVYVVANLRGGGQQFEVLELEEIEAHRNRSRAKDSGPWANANDYPAMAMKTGIRKIAKYLPKSTELLSRILDLDDRADRGEDQLFELPPDAEVFDTEPVAPGSTNRLDHLTKRLGGQSDTIDELRETKATDKAPVPTAEEIFGGLKREPGEEG